jgi:hypothetical protein
MEHTAHELLTLLGPSIAHAAECAAGQFCAISEGFDKLVGLAGRLWAGS